MRKLICISENDTAKNMLEEAALTTLSAGGAIALDEKHIDQLKEYLREECVVLSGSWNSSVSTRALGILEEARTPCLFLAGMNLPMVIAAISFKDDVDTLEELSETLQAQAAAGIKALHF